MALTLVTTDGTLVTPGAPATWETAPANSGLSTTGVVVLVGEADIGPDFSSESDISQNYFGPRQFAAVQAKYGSGHLVDAYRALTNPSLDPAVKGSPSSVFIVKTNKGEKADGALGTYGVLQAKKEGDLGNLIAYGVSEKVAQVLPAVSAAYVRDALAETIKVSVDGLATWDFAATPGYTTPALAAVGLANYLDTGVNQSHAKGVIVSGGTAYEPCNAVVSNISVAIAGNQVTISLASDTWATQPVAGQTLIIPTGSTIQGAGNENRGFYIVLSSTLNSVVALKVKDAAGTTPTAPVVVAPTAASGTDFQVYDPITFTGAKGVKRADQTGITTWSGAVSGSYYVISATTPPEVWSTTPKAGDLCKFARSGAYWWFKVISATTNSVTLQQLAPTPAVSAIAGFASEAVGASTIEFLRPNIPGLGQSLLFYRDPTSTGVQFYDADGAAADISSTGNIYISSAEQKVTFGITRAADSVNESLSAGGDVVLTIGKDSAVAATVSISDYTLTLGSDATVDLRKYKTIGDLSTYINTLVGWHAYAVPAFKQLSPHAVIDHVSASGTQDVAGAANWGLTGAMPCRLKKDAYAAIAAVGTSRVAEFAPTYPVKGLPEVQSVAFLSGGVKGSTSNANVQAALDAAGLIRGNFVVTLFSQDATADIADGETESSSSYDIATVNAALSDHISRFSQFKARKPRQGFPSYRGTYADSKTQAQVLANFRAAAVNFLDVNVLGSNGLQWFQPWMASAIEAGMQAAGFYRPLFNKAINISGVRSNAGDFNPADDDAVEDALLNGLTVVKQRDGGGFIFAKDNTTYGVDNNFALNSVQAIYVADVVSQTTSQRMEKAFIGQSFADVNPSVAMSFFKNIMASLKALKLIAASSDAPSGYKNVIIDIQAPAMYVTAEVKLATGLYFAPIKFLVTQVEGTVTA